MKRKTTAGLTSQIWQIAIADNTSTTGAGLDGLVWNTSGLEAKFKLMGSADWTVITFAPMTGGTYTSGGFVASDSGAGGGYEFCPPNSVYANPGTVIVELFGAANMAPVRIEIELDQIDYEQGVVPKATDVTNAVVTDTASRDASKADVSDIAKKGDQSWTIGGDTQTVNVSQT